MSDVEPRKRRGWRPNRPNGSCLLFASVKQIETAPGCVASFELVRHVHSEPT